MIKGKRVFVSGGAGVIGLEMIPLLVVRGANILVGDLKPRPRSFPKGVRYRQGDLNYLTTGELASFAPEIFIHLAATFERSTETYGFWEENSIHNVCLSHHLMTLAKDMPCLKRVVFASSYLIIDPERYQFDTPQMKPVSLNEADPIRPRNLIGMAKLLHEMELRFLDGFRAADFTSVCARIYRGYGRNSRDVISRWIRALQAGQAVIVYRPEGLFDYIYAKDSAEGLIRLAAADHVGGVINLGTGRARRVQDVLDVLRTHFPKMRIIEETSDIPFEASQADITRYMSAIGWVPEYDLERAIPEIIDHERSLRQKAVSTFEVGNVLVTSAGKKAPLVRAVQHAARKLHPDGKVIAGDVDANALTRYVADEFWHMSRAKDDEVDALLAGLKARGIRTVIPTRDGELLFWALHRAQFLQKGIDVVVSPASSIEVCLDKLAFAQFGAENRLPFIPAGVHPDKVGAGPYVVKERYGAGARKIGLNLDRERALAHGDALEAPIYQPFVGGQEISVDAWLSQGHQVKGLVLRTRDHIVGGESQVTTSFRDDSIEKEVTRALHVLKLRGPVVMQVFIDANRRIHIIECNTRIGGASTASIAAGLDIFYWSLLESYGADLDEYPFDRVCGEIRQIRVVEDIHVHGSGF